MRSTPALDKLDKWLGLLAGLLAFIGSAAVIWLTLVTVVAVFWRYFLNNPIFGIEDLSTMGLTVAVAGSIAYGATRGAHISVNVLNYFVGRSVTRYTDALVRLLGIGIISFAAYALAVKGSCGMKCGAFTANLAIIHQPFYYLLALAMATYAVMLVIQFWRGMLYFREDADPYDIKD